MNYFWFKLNTMKKILFLLLFIPLVTFGQDPIKVEIVPASSYRNPKLIAPVSNKVFLDAVDKSAEKRMSQAATIAAAKTAAASAKAEALKDNYETIEIDLIKETPDKYKYVVIKKVAGWKVTQNFETIATEIRNAKKYVLLNDMSKIKGKSSINKSKLYKPSYVSDSSIFSNPEVLFLEWTRENISTYDRITRLVLKNSLGKTVYQAEYKNKGYIEMLRPVLSDYRFSKDDAKKQLLELKEFLDLGIITQDEFDKKAVSLKKILLGN